MSEVTVNEKILWQRFKSGDRYAFSQIYHAYYKDLYRYGFKILNDSDKTRDCIQNFFLYLWERKSNLGELETIKYYLIKSFRRHVFRFIDKERKIYSIETELSHFEPDITFSREEILIREEQQESLRTFLAEILNDLPPRQKEIIYLKYYAGLEYKQIAQILNINYQSVLNSLHRAFKKITQTKSRPIFFCLLAFAPFLY